MDDESLLQSARPALQHEVAAVRRYQDDFKAGIVANTNVGGENCHRGAAIGAVLGAHCGASAIPADLKEGLHDYKAIKDEIEAYVACLPSAVAP